MRVYAEYSATDKRAFADQGWALNRLAFAATRPSVDVALRNFTRDFVFAYASNNCYQICEADITLISLCPFYKTSRRRLALLRHALPDAPGPYGREYVTNAINELVAYPEANLPAPRPELNLDSRTKSGVWGWKCAKRLSVKR